MIPMTRYRGGTFIGSFLLMVYVLKRSWMLEWLDAPLFSCVFVVDEAVQESRLCWAVQESCNALLCCQILGFVVWREIGEFWKVLGGGCGLLLYFFISLLFIFCIFLYLDLVYFLRYCFFFIQPGAFHVNDLDRILSFTDSHTIGVGMVRGNFLLKILLSGWILFYYTLFVCLYSFYVQV